MKILLIDDDKWTQEIIEKILKINYLLDVDIYDDVIEAFKRLKTNQYDIAFIDFKLCNVTGASLIRSLDGLNLTTRLFLMTGYDEDYIHNEIKDIIDLIEGVIYKPNLNEGFGKIFGVKAKV